MINPRKLVRISTVAGTQSSILSATVSRNNIMDNISRQRNLVKEEKIQKLREETFNSLTGLINDRNKKGNLTNVLLTALGIGGTGRIIRRFRGGGGGRPGGGGGRGIPPKLPKSGIAKGLSKFRLGPAAVIGTGLDFFSRKQAGQSNLQAGGGALAGLGGFAGGAKLGALLGTAILPGVGTAAGGLLGGALGGLLGGNLFDRLYGQNILRAGSDFRRIQEEETTRQRDTLFSKNLDQLDGVLDKLEKKAPLLGESQAIAQNINKKIEAIVAPRVTPNRFPIGKTLLIALDILAIASAFTPTGVDQTVSVPYVATRFPSLANRIMSLKKAMSLKKFSQTSGFVAFSKNADKITNSLSTRMTNAFRLNFGKSFKPALSPKGIKVRAQALIESLKKENVVERVIPRFLKGKFNKNRLNKDFVRKILNKKNLENRITAESKIFKSGQESDAFVSVVRKVLKQGEFVPGNYTKREIEIFRAFKNSIDDMIDSDFIDARNVDELIKFLRQVEIGPSGAKDVINIQKVIKQLKNTPLGSEIFNSEGGVMTGPESGYVAILHGKERIIPEENQYTRSRGKKPSSTNVITIIAPPKQNQQTQPFSSGSSVVVPIFKEANPYDVATKYSEMIGHVTV